MQRLLARGGPLVLFLGLWAFVGGLLATLLVAGGGLGWTAALAVALPLAAVYAFVCLSSWYVARSMPLGGTGALRTGATAALAAIISSAGWLGLARVWMRALGSRGVSGVADLAGVDALIFGFGLLLYLLSLAISYLFVSVEQSREAERHSFEAQVLAREAELRSLRAQIDPHFLFNSLHSISALTAADPAGARRMCLLLADFLRDTLMVGAEARIPLSRELELAGRFLDVERVRFGSRLQACLDPGNAGDCLVPPLMLQPIVENAVTHGIAHALDGGTIRIAARCSPTQLFIVVDSPCESDRPRRDGGGVGLSNVRGRLRALHGNDARVTTAEQDGVWRVEVMMPAAMRPAGLTP